MEVAGLALGVYPVVCLLLEQYKDGAKYVKNYRRFDRNYTSFITDIGSQQYNFEGLLYDLMCSGSEPYLTGSISRRQFLEKARSQDFNGWTDPRLHKILEMRLDDSYEFVSQRLNEVWETFQELESLLQIQEASFLDLYGHLKSALRLMYLQYHGSKETADYWKFQWQRAKQTWFQPTYLEKCRKMEDQINQVKQRVTSCDERREREMGSNTMSFGGIWLTAFESATNLYNVLKTAWRCRCSLNHKTLLNLRSLIAESSRQSEKGFNIIFALSFSSNTGDNQNLAASPQGSKEWEVFLKNRVSTRPKATLSLTGTSLPALTMAGTVIQASKSVPTDINISEAEKMTNLSTLPTTDTVSVRSSVISGGKESMRSQKEGNDLDSLSVSSKSRSHVSRHMQSLASKFSLLRIHKQPSVKSSSSAHSPNISSPMLPKSFKVQGHMLPNTPRAFSPRILPESAQVVSALEVPDLSEAVLSQPSSTAPSNTGSSNALADTEVIPDLCKALWTSKGTSCLGYLGNKHDSHSCLQLFCQNSATTPAAGSKTTKSLKEILTLSPRIFSRSEKALVALTLAKAILQLHTTQWVDENWTNKDVLFRTQGSSVIFEDVYFAREFPSFVSNSSLPSLPPIEGLSPSNEAQQDPSRAQVAAKIARLRNSLECLGIVLVEISLGASLESLDEYILWQGGKGKSSDVPDHATLCDFAKDLSTLDTVMSNEPQYYGPVQCCFEPRNLLTLRNRGYGEVMEDLYNEIVPPLEKLNQDWR